MCKMGCDRSRAVSPGCYPLLMHLDRAWSAALSLSLLAACGVARRDSQAPARESGASQSAPAENTLVAGGETSEFSGGNVVFGYCPNVTSRTSLDLARADVAELVALAAGHHEIPLRWRREFPDDRIRGFAERTSLVLDVQVIAAEDVLCESPRDDSNYETSGYRALLRRLELAVELSSADGAVRGAFQQPFVTAVAANGERELYGRERLPIGELEGTLELGVDPELVTESETLSVDITFAAPSAYGTLTPWVMLPGPYQMGGGRPSWVPVSGAFPAPGEGCEAGSSVPLDEPIDFLGDTPRAAYDLARARFPAQPLRAAWQDTWHDPSSLSWTELALSPGPATHACLNGRDLDVYASLRLESADGQVQMEPVVVARVGLQPAAAGQARTAHDFSLSASGRWTPRAELEAKAGIRDLDLGLADYGAVFLYQTFNSEDDKLQGELSVRKWQDHLDSSLEHPVLLWCSGAGCERYWCSRSDDGPSCR